jgi:hypothetical protein
VRSIFLDLDTGIHRPEPIEAFFARQAAPAAQL